jgi:hemolysin activation/secretion protein
VRREPDLDRPDFFQDSPLHRSHRRPRRHAVSCAAAVLLGSSAAAYAQTPPDAGSLLQQIEQQRRPALPPKGTPQFTPPPPLQSIGGATVTVTAFRFAGNTLLSAAQLAPVVAEFQNKPLDFAALQNAAIAVAAAYRKAGWVVRAYLPQQDITGGVVTIQIVEAVFGAVHVDGDAKRVSAARLTRIVEAAQPPGTPLNGDALDRALLLIDDLPGVNAKGRLVEGQSQAETDVVLDVGDGPLLTGDVTADNGGARSTGAARATADASLNSPLGFGDRADGLLLHTQGSSYARVAYSAPVGSNGWRLGVNASYLSYKVVTAQFEALDARGNSSTGGVEASYPLLRSQLKNLYFSFTFDDKRFDNQSAGATTTKYKVQVASLGLYGNAFDNLGGGGANSGAISVEQGRVDLNGSPNQSADAATTQTAGSFQKLRFAASRQQVLTDTLSLYAAVSGQMASKNLDSSERFYLGGATGVRAYPVSEGGGAQGALLNLEARAHLPWNLSGTGFFDWGTVQANKNNDIVGAAVPNHYDLKGLGVSIGWVAPIGLALKATFARRLGSNPNPSVTGSDQDGSLVRNRVWLQASLPF